MIRCKWDGSTCMLLGESNGHDHPIHFQGTVLYVHETIPFGADHLSLISATAIKTAIQGDLVGISNLPFQIWILLKKLVQVQVEPSHLQQITYSEFHPLPLKQPYRVIWWEFQISLFRSGFASENWSKSKLNHPICSRSLLIDLIVRNIIPQYIPLSIEG